MMIIGCDFHPSWQQVSWLDTETGEVGERKLAHASGDAQQFYGQLSAPALIGMEATGNSQWFVELVEDLGHAVWIGDAKARSANQDNNSPNTGSNNLGIAPAGWVPQTQNQQMKAGNRTTIPNQKGMKPTATPNLKEKKPANDGVR